MRRRRVGSGASGQQHGGGQDSGGDPHGSPSVTNQVLGVAKNARERWAARRGRPTPEAEWSPPPCRVALCLPAGQRLGGWPCVSREASHARVPGLGHQHGRVGTVLGVVGQHGAIGSPGRGRGWQARAPRIRPAETPVTAPLPAKRSSAVRRDIAEAERRAAAARTPVARKVTAGVVKAKRRAAGGKPAKATRARQR